MAYGLEILNAAGITRLSVTDRLTRLMYSAEVAYTSSGSASVPGITSANAVVTALAVGASGPAIPHECWVTDDTVHWTAQPTPGPGATDFRCTTLLLVFRYK